MKKRTPLILGKVMIHLYEMFGDDIDHEACQIFEEHISAYQWVLREDGAIICKEAKDEGLINLVIDLGDLETREAFNRLPRYFSHDHSLDLSKMRMKVTMNTEHVEFSPWDRDEEDALVFNHSSIYVESVKDMYEMLQKANAVADADPTEN